jgi:sugar phosphate isomerase/epimerase
MNRRHFLVAAAALARMAGAADTRLRLGCQTRAYGSPIRDREKLLAVLDDLAAVGYEGFETNFASLQASFADPAPMRGEIEKRRVPLIGLHLGTGFYDPARIEQEQAQVLEVARATKAFGGTHLMLSGNHPRGEWTAEMVDRKCRELNRAARACRELGIQLCAHNHGRELEHGGEHFRELMAGTYPDLVSFVFDVGNPFPADFSPLESIGRFLNRIAAFHLRDTKQGKEVLTGSGEFDFAGLGKLLHERNWSGWLIIELNRRDDIPSRKLIADARDYIRQKTQI